MAEKYTFKQFQAQYSNDDACLDAILQRRYGHIEACPNCGVTGKLTRIAGRRAYACKEGCHIYPCAGTVFEKSTTSLTLWFHAMYLMTSTRNGVSAKELQRQLGVTYKCAWRIGHQLRELMAARDKANNPGPLEGHVEIDETYVGGKVKGKGRRYVGNKAVVMGMVQRGGPFKGQVIENAKQTTLLPIIAKNIKRGSTVSTDTLSAYKLLNRVGYNHGAVNHTDEEWVAGVHHTNRIEGFWSHLKRGIGSTHVAVSHKYLQKYVDEFAFRYNNRQAPAEMFQRLVAQISKPISS
ncbi:MAG TPA: IS1595 family transposase [Burkholderiales bacterium]|nr:IS1595 family transposase [Burkholderiales bacterium]